MSLLIPMGINWALGFTPIGIILWGAMSHVWSNIRHVTP